MRAMLYVYATALVVVNAFFLFLVVLGLPGTWLMVVAAGLLGWWQWDPGASLSEQIFHPLTLLTAAALALLGEIFEFFLGMAGSKKAGGSRRGAVWALVGGIAGGVVGTFLIPVPLVGSLIGACAGAFLGAATGETSAGVPLSRSLESGKGAAVGRFTGTVAKLIVAVVIWVEIAVAAFW